MAPEPAGLLKSSTREALLSAALAAGMALLFHWLLYPRVTDPDSFYHVGHARLYAGTSVFDSSFPWTAFSAIGREGADLWWGFHLLLVPLSGGDDLAAAVRRSAAVLTLAGLFLVAWVALRHRFLAAALWAPVFFLAVPNVLFRYLAVRPEVLSVPLALLLLSALVRREALLTLAAATALTWIHLSMFWLGPGVWGTWALATAAMGWAGRSRAGVGPGGPLPEASRPTPRRLLLPGAVVAAGTALGWALRPEPLGAARLAWIQIAELLFEKTGGVPLTFAVELSPLDLRTLGVMAWPLLLPWGAAIAVGARRGWRRQPSAPPAETQEEGPSPPSAEGTHLLASLVLAAGFLALTLLVARRSLVLWAAFATLSLALLVGGAVPASRREAASRLLLLALPLLFGYALWRNALNVRFVAQPPDAFAEVGGWLEANARPGDLVFNTHWDTFGPLFARAPVVRYVGGMDPIFQFARSPERYWEFHHLSTDAAAELTCAEAVCTPDNVRDSWVVLREGFGARWVVVEPRRNPRFTLYLLNDPRYRLALETPREAVFEVLAAAAASPPPP